MRLGTHVGPLIEPISGRRWDRQQIGWELSRRIAYYHQQGMRTRNRVFIHHGNCLEFFVDLLAIWHLGSCAIPIDPRLTPFEVNTLAQAVRPRFSLYHADRESSSGACLIALDITRLESSAQSLDRVNTHRLSIPRSRLVLDDAALMLFTSGTTSHPKAVVHTHRSLRARWLALRQCLGLESYRRTLCLLPTHFGHGLICNSLFPWLAGQELYIVPPFQSDLLLQLGTLIDTHKITFMSSVPALWRFALRLAKPPQAQTLERVFCGSAPLSASLWQSIQTWTSTPNVWNIYGITETASWVAGTSMPDCSPEDGLIGETWGSDVIISRRDNSEEQCGLQPECAPGEAGEIWLQTPSLMQGYFEREALTQRVVEQGWFRTGDIGFVDERGRLYLRGREREEINKGGMKVYPGDIDAVLERYLGVEDVCSFGYDEDILYGQNVGTAVVMQDTSEESMRKLYTWARQHLATYQMPMRWYCVDHIPRTSRGKLNRTDVASTCASLSPVLMPKKF